LGADGGPGLALKPENLQPVGAFKLRGAHNAIAALCERSRPAMVVTHSSGNHARGVAYAARTFGLPATIVMPETTPAVKVEATRALGATVELVHPSRRAARAAELVADDGAALVHPYDDPLVIAGQGTVGAEIVADAPDIDLVIAPVSGGGLISGIAVAVKSVRPEAKVIGVEPELAADARDSLRAGERREWPLERVQRTIADALRVTAIGELPWEHIRAYVDDIVAVTDDELRSAVRLLALRARLVAEPGGAASPRRLPLPSPRAAAGPTLRRRHQRRQHRPGAVCGDSRRSTELIRGESPARCRGSRISSQKAGAAARQALVARSRSHS
jgi:threonine dehydratase